MAVNYYFVLGYCFSEYQKCLGVSADKEEAIKIGENAVGSDGISRYQIEEIRGIFIGKTFYEERKNVDNIFGY